MGQRKTIGRDVSSSGSSGTLAARNGSGISNVLQNAVLLQEARSTCAHQQVLAQMETEKCTVAADQHTVWIGTRVAREPYPLSSHPDLRITPQLKGGAPPSHRQAHAPHNMTTRSANSTTGRRSTAESAPTPSFRLVYVIGRVLDDEHMSIEREVNTFNGHPDIQEKCRNLEVAGHRYLRRVKSKFGTSLVAKVDIPGGTELCYYIGTIFAARYNPPGNHCIDMGLGLRINASRLPHNLCTGACMHQLQHSCNPNSTVDEFVPNGYNGDFVLLICSSSTFIKKGAAVTIRYGPKMWQRFDDLPERVPPNFTRIRCLCSEPCPEGAGRLGWIGTEPPLTPEEHAQWIRGRMLVLNPELEKSTPSEENHEVMSAPNTDPDQHLPTV